uniref:Uncharacterized protein LOC113797580 n=1 Tax=Dermatophagoides pteronyssinus TaxID=6956 RepID=A0A6P6YE71_DERPT
MSQTATEIFSSIINLDGRNDAESNLSMDSNMVIDNDLKNDDEPKSNESNDVSDGTIVDNLPTLAEIFEIRGKKSFFKSIVEKKLITSTERQELVECVGYFLSDHYKTLSIPIKSLQYCAKELSKISQDSEGDYFCYWKSSRIRGGRVVEHKKPIGKLYKFFEYRRRKFRRGQRSLFAEKKTKKNSIEMDDSGNNIVDQKKKLDAIIPILANKSIIFNLFSVTYTLRNIIRCNCDDPGSKLIKEFECFFFFDGLLIEEEFKLIYPHSNALNEKAKINELIKKFKIFSNNDDDNNDDDDDNEFMNLFIFLKKKLKCRSPITTRKACIDLSDEYDGLLFNLQMNDDVAAISKKINDIYNFPT